MSLEHDDARQTRAIKQKEQKNNKIKNKEKIREGKKSKK